MKDQIENKTKQNKRLICLFCRGTFKLEKVENHIKNDHDVHFDCALIIDLVRLGKEALNGLIMNHKMYKENSSKQQHEKSKIGPILYQEIKAANVEESKLISLQEIDETHITEVIEMDDEIVLSTISSDIQNFENLNDEKVFCNDSTYFEETKNKEKNNETNLTVNSKIMYIQESDKMHKQDVLKGDNGLILSKSSDKQNYEEMNDALAFSNDSTYLEKGINKEIDNDTNFAKEISFEVTNIVAPVNINLKKVIRDGKVLKRTLLTEGSKNKGFSNPIDSKYDCKICDRSFTSALYLYNHGKKVHPQHLDLFPGVPSAPLRQLHTRIAEDGENGKEFKCAISSCKFTFDTFRGLMIHENRWHKEDFICAFCGLVCHVLNTLIEHYDNDHVDTSVYACRICGRFNFDQRDYNVHNQDEHAAGEIKLFKCTKCDYITEKRRELVNHKSKTHTERKLLHCEHCGKEFSSKSAIHNHQRAYHSNGKNIKMIKCDYCPKQFLPNKLREHMYTHTKQKKLYCELCGKGYPNKSSLKKHEFIKHTAEDNFLYYCDTCGKGFKRKSTYVDHCKLHLDQRDKICHLCGSAYVSNKSLSKHKKSAHSTAMSTEAQ